MPLDGAYCNALLIAHWSVGEKLHKVTLRLSLVQLRSLSALEWSVYVARFANNNNDNQTK